MEVEKAEKYILKQLSEFLPVTLYYHGLHHVQDVTDAALRLAALENCNDPEEVALLKTAALYHDAGFLQTYQAHEEEGCRLVRTVLPGFNYSSPQIDVICGMIMSTRIPQSPTTHLERIICDADLDYLGRPDFERIATTLFQELKVQGKVSDLQTWNTIQIRFLEAHQYWTHAAKKSRDEQKKIHLQHLKQFQTL